MIARPRTCRQEKTPFRGRNSKSSFGLSPPTSCSKRELDCKVERPAPRLFRGSRSAFRRGCPFFWSWTGIEFVVDVSLTPQQDVVETRLAAISVVIEEARKTGLSLLLRFAITLTFSRKGSDLSLVGVPTVRLPNCQRRSRERKQSCLLFRKLRYWA